jgi:hypothetical protein
MRIWSALPRSDATSWPPQGRVATLRQIGCRARRSFVTVAYQMPKFRRGASTLRRSFHVPQSNARSRTWHALVKSRCIKRPHDDRTWCKVIRQARLRDQMQRADMSTPDRFHETLDRLIRESPKLHFYSEDDVRREAKYAKKYGYALSRGQPLFRSIQRFFGYFQCCKRDGRISAAGFQGKRTRTLECSPFGLLTVGT